MAEATDPGISERIPLWGSLRGMNCLLDPNGGFVVPLTHDLTISDEPEELVLAWNRAGFRYIDPHGKTSPVEDVEGYPLAGPFSCGFAAVCVVYDGFQSQVWRYVDRRLESPFSSGFGYAGRFVETYAMVSDEVRFDEAGQSCFHKIDTSGRIKHSIIAAFVGEESDHLHLYYDGVHLGYLHHDLTVTVAARFSQASPPGDGVAIVQEGDRGRPMIINIATDSAIAEAPGIAGYGFRSGVTVIRLEGKDYLYDVRGKKIFGPADKINRTRCGSYRIRVSRRWGLLDCGGSELLPAIFSTLSQPVSGRVACSADDTLSIVDIATRDEVWRYSVRR